MTVRRIRGWKHIDIHPYYCGEFEITDNSSELWIDISHSTDWDPITASNDPSIKKIVFFDWLHTTPRLSPKLVELVKLHQLNELTQIFQLDLYDDSNQQRECL